MYGFRGRGSHRGPGLHVAEKPCVRSLLECSGPRFAISSSSVAFIVPAPKLSQCATRTTLHRSASGGSPKDYASSAGRGHLYQSTTTPVDRFISVKATGHAKYPQPIV